MQYAKIYTLGCRLNHADSALLAARLSDCGFTLTDDADIIPALAVVNSCAVTAEAQTKTRKLIARLRREMPQTEIWAAGCAAELDKDQLLRAGADAVFTNPGKRELDKAEPGVKSITLEPDNFKERSFSSFPFRTRAFIKVQEGCDNFCSYCIVPTVRGPSRSRDFDESLADCRTNIERGFPEIILTGVNTCNYLDSGRTLTDLIKAVAALPGEFRIRLSSTEPHPADLSLPELIASTPKLCRFLHISMQHGCDRILKLMKRRYLAEEFAEYIAKARKLVPDIHIGTDIIVGFPGETEQDFADSLANIKRIGFANIHAFAYSKRPGTPAAAMPGQVHPDAVKERMAELRKIAGESAKNFSESQYGKMLPVIFERVSGNTARGWSDNYLPVTVPAADVECGKIVMVRANAENISGNGE